VTNNQNLTTNSKEKDMSEETINDRLDELSPEAGGRVVVANELGNDVEIELATAPRRTSEIPQCHFTQR